MYKLVCFDIDNTLASLNAPIAKDSIELIKKIQNLNIQVMFISGKPTAYIAGIVRQTGLKNIIISGGNGETLSSSHQFPPAFSIRNDITADEIEFLSDLKQKILEGFNDDIWFQPNEFQLSIFHYENSEIESQLVDLISKEINKKSMDSTIKFYQHIDCIDVLPITISKGNMIKKLSKKLNYATNSIITVGDSSNDVSMFKISGLSIGIKNNIDADKNFETIKAALQYIYALLNQ